MTPHDHPPPSPRPRASAAMLSHSHDSASRAPRRGGGAQSDALRARFVALSVVLTGYDDAELWGTGMVDPYLGWLLGTVGDQITGDLLSASDAAVATANGDEDALERLFLTDIFPHQTLGPLVRNLVVLWYLGQWNQLPPDWRDAHGASALDQTCIISPDAYAQGLVWKAANTHPQGAKQPGFASWALPPAGTPNGAKETP